MPTLDDPLIANLIASVPPYDRFPTVDALHAEAEALAREHPTQVSIRSIGRSRLGESLRCLTVGDGPGNAVVIGLPHPGEPFGALTAIHFARRLAEDAALREQLGLTWHIVPCADPDGARLNEPWFVAPVTPGSYSRAFYRPALDEQVEWTFPLDGEGEPALPEARALKALLDQTRPVLQCSLHNSEGGGVYYYLARAAPDLHPLLAEIPERLGLPLHAGAAEVPGVESLAPAIYRLTTGAELKAIIAELGGAAVDQWPGGTCSHDYAIGLGTQTVVCEVPYWVDPRAHDDAPSGNPYAGVVRGHAERLETTIGVLRAALDATADARRIDSPFARASLDFVAQLDALPVLYRQRGDDAGDREATTAEAWSCDHELRMIRLTVGGMARRALDAELAAGNVAAPIRVAREALSAELDGWIAEAEREMPSHPESIARLVSAQLMAIVAAARTLGG